MTIDRHTRAWLMLPIALPVIFLVLAAFLLAGLTESARQPPL